MVRIRSSGQYKDCFIRAAGTESSTAGHAHVVIQTSNTLLYGTTVGCSSLPSTSELLVNSLLLDSVGIEDGTQAEVSRLSDAPDCWFCELVPDSAEDYEILEQNRDLVESTLMSQILLVSIDLRFPIWLNSARITVTVAAIQPNDVPCCVLTTETTVAVAPKTFNNADNSINDSEPPRSIVDVLPEFVKQLCGMVDSARLESWNAQVLSETGGLKQRLLLRVDRSTDAYAYLPYDIAHKELCSLKRARPAEGSSESVFTTSKLITHLRQTQVEHCSGIPHCLLPDRLLSLLGVEQYEYVVVEPLATTSNKLAAAWCSLDEVELQPMIENISDDELKRSWTEHLNSLNAFAIICSGDCFTLAVNGTVVPCVIRLHPATLEWCYVDVLRAVRPQLRVSHGIAKHKLFSPEPEAVSCTDVVSYGSFETSSSKIASTLSCLLKLPRTSGVLLTCDSCAAGRTTLLRHVVQRLRNSGAVGCEWVDCRQLKGKSPANLLTHLSRHFARATERQPCLVVLDDMNAIFGQPTAVETLAPAAALEAERAAEVLDLLYARYSTKGVAVLASAPSTSVLHDHIRTQQRTHFFADIVQLPLPSKPDRKYIQQQLFQLYNDVELDDVAARCDGFTLGDLVRLQKRVAFVKEDSEHPFKSLTSALEGFWTQSLEKRPSDSKSLPDWAEVCGLEAVKRTLTECVLWPLTYPALFAKCPVRLPCGSLLFGPPGCGKTMVALALAKKANCAVITVKGPELLSKYIGASEQSVRDVFQRARSSRPCLLIFDEFDSLAPRRGHDSTGVTDRVVNQLLTELDGVEQLNGVFVLATTSRPELLDPALLRPGRLDKLLFCDFPNVASRCSLISDLASEVDLSDLDIRQLCNRTANFSCADIRAVFVAARTAAVRQAVQLKSHDVSVTEEHVMNALSNTQPSLGEHERLESSVRYRNFINPSASITPDVLIDSRVTLA